MLLAVGSKVLSQFDIPLRRSAKTFHPSSDSQLERKLDSAKHLWFSTHICPCTNARMGFKSIIPPGVFLKK
jgi:hypothetical protein